MNRIDPEICKISKVCVFFVGIKLKAMEQHAIWL